MASFPAASSIAHQAGVVLQPASAAALDQLAALGFPARVLEFYALHEPSRCAEIGRVRMWPVNEIVEENTEYVRGADLQPRGYSVFATTLFDDAQCLDMTSVASHEAPPVVIMSHEVAWADMSTNEVTSYRKQVASSFEDFLDAFVAGQRDIEPRTEAAFISPEQPG